MSELSGSNQDLKDPWVRLSIVLQTAKDIKQSFSMLLEPSINGNKYCSLGYARKAAGQNTLEVMFGSFTTKLYGFNKEERKMLRRCTEPDCDYIGTLGSLIPHLNDYHRLKIPMIGKILPAIKEDKRPTPTKSEYRKSNLKYIIKALLK